MNETSRQRKHTGKSTSALTGGAGRLSMLASRLCRPFRFAAPVPARLLLLAGIGLAAVTPAAADDGTAQDKTAQDGKIAPAISVELNRLEDVDNGCRLSFVFTNTLPVAVDGLAIEAVLFDTKGQVDRFLLLKARPLTPAKTRVQQFDVGQAACSDIGQVLLNDVTACAGDDLDAPKCLDAIRPQSRADVPFTTALTPDSQ